MPPSVSVVVPTYNRCTLLSQTLPALLAQDRSAEDYEVIVVVDGSTDGTGEYLASLSSHAPNLRVESQPNGGPALARNRGIELSAGELVLMLDDDLLAERDLLSRHLELHDKAEGTSQLVFGAVTTDGSDGDPASKKTRLWLESCYAGLETGSLRWPDHARAAPNFSVKREILRRFGAYDETFAYAHEDMELGQRLWKAGVKFSFLSRAAVRQISRKTNDELCREAPSAGRSEVKLCRRYPEYRRHSVIAASRQANSVWRVVRETAVAAPVSLEPLLAGLARRKPKSMRLLEWSNSLSQLRAAREECGAWSHFHKEFWQTLPVLLYHNVGLKRSTPFPALTVEPKAFSAQMRCLKQFGFHSITSAEWLAWCDTAKPLPPKPFLLTFDDAYAELTDFAFPILRELGFQATVFVPTAKVAGSNDWDRAFGAPAMPIMTTHQIKYWREQGITFGAHSRHHVDLSKVDATVLADEVIGSADDLSSLLGQEVTAFAYPWGEFDAAAEAVVRQKYRLAFTTDEGLNELATDPYRLRRTMVQPGDDGFAVLRKVLLGCDPIHNLRKQLRLRERWRRPWRKT